jgi:multiple PDZ domain protein
MSVVHWNILALESSDQIEDRLEFSSPMNINEQIRLKWCKVLGNNYQIHIAQIVKPDNGGLGITLEGTVDIENGEEVRPHHYIRALLREGPIATEGTLKAGDELLEVRLDDIHIINMIISCHISMFKVNNQILYGKNHVHVIEILKRVKDQVLLVCARRHVSNENDTSKVNTRNPNRSRSISFGKTAEIVVKAKSMGTLDSTNLSINLLSSSIRTTDPFKSRSLEVISDLALWSTSIVTIELQKGDFGLGFSVLDYQDPSNPSHSPVIVIRALVPGGVAQLDGRVVPGDRLVAVNDITLENMNLDDVIQILKSTPKGPVKLSLSKPLPYPKFRSDHDDRTVTDSDQDTHNKIIHSHPARLSKSHTTTSMISDSKVCSTITVRDRFDSQ